MNGRTDTRKESILYDRIHKQALEMHGMCSELYVMPEVVIQ